MTVAAYPLWPSPTYQTREEAIAVAMLNLGPGDQVTVHEQGCAAQFDSACDCTPQVIVVPDEVLS